MESSAAIIARFRSLFSRSIDLDLARVRRLLAALRHPERRLPPVIHVAGTNGKGSTIAFMRAILEAAGLRVHVFTSPHLVRFHERIRLGRIGGGELVTEERLVRALTRAEELNAGQPITEFEITTAAALDIFAATPAEILLLEVGLGGRGDATNVVDAPACAVITPIGLDHTDRLGNSLAAIAREKAGIMKAGCPLVVAPQDHAEVDAVLRERAEAVGCRPAWIGGQDFGAHAERGRLVYQDESGLMDLPAPRLVGPHQLVNAGTAIAALKAAGFGDLEMPVFETGIAEADWPGRLQLLSRGRLAELLPEGAELWLDGGHNPDGGRAVASALADLEDRSPAPLVLVSAMLANKDAAGFLAHFQGLARELIAVPLPGGSAGKEPAELAAIADGAGIRVSTAGGIEAALGSIAGTAFERPPRVLICGSLYLAGEALALNGTPPT